jgi:hypothetical protein
MADTLVDTNVLIDISGETEEWFDWSSRHLAEAADSGQLVVNQIIYSELAGAYATREDLDGVLAAAGIRKEGVPWDAAFMAGLIFRTHRTHGGRRRTPPPDFYVGAHAAVRDYNLLTRDRGFYRSYFPTLSVVSPDTHP